MNKRGKGNKGEMDKRRKGQREQREKMEYTAQLLAKSMEHNDKIYTVGVPGSDVDDEEEYSERTKKGRVVCCISWIYTNYFFR